MQAKSPITSNFEAPSEADLASAQNLMVSFSVASGSPLVVQ
jgi:hypothetical protein